jgi:hypothetical protein
MERTFIHLKIFDKNWSRLGLTDADLQDLQKAISENPEAGDLIKGTGGLRKLRYALPDRGKSGGVRVLYVDYAFYEKAALINVFSKSRKADITDAERQTLKKLISVLEKELGR